MVQKFVHFLASKCSGINIEMLSFYVRKQVVDSNSFEYLSGGFSAPKNFNLLNESTTQQ